MRDQHKALNTLEPEQAESLGHVTCLQESGVPRVSILNACTARELQLFYSELSRMDTLSYLELKEASAEKFAELLRSMRR